MKLKKVFICFGLVLALLAVTGTSYGQQSDNGEPYEEYDEYDDIEDSEYGEDSEKADKEEAKKESKTDKAHPDDGFHFGTYGRAQASSDFSGRLGEDTNIVAHGTRLMEGPYVELDFGYVIHTDDGFGVRVLTTVAFLGEVFHYSGEVDQIIALRNLYAEAENFLPIDLKLWIGSRMYRGDDIYLLDYWPLDNLNTYGGGLQWDGGGFRLKWHIGVNRLLNKYQLATLDVPVTFGAQEITVMERQKLISSAKASYFAFNLSKDFSMKFSLYGEIHHLPDGEYEYSDDDEEYLKGFALDPDSEYSQDLPDDFGWVLGVQLGMWGFGQDSHMNVFFRYARDLAAYGEWGSPWGLGADHTAKGAQEFVASTSFNWESHWFGIMAGGYLRYFEDADPNEYDLDDFWEGILSVRPAIFVTRHFHQMFEISHQWKRPNGLSPQGNVHRIPQAVQISVIPALSLDRGMYQRPQFRLVYTASWLNGDARALFPAWDRRKDGAWQHFFGAQVEWWLDSSSYK